MIPRTSRTGALRAASAACAAAPSFLALPLLVGAFLAVLWLLAAPVQADTATGSGTLGAPVTETASAAGGALGLGEAPALEKQNLERVVPEEVTEPVTATLGTVHQRLEKGTADTAAVAATLHEPAAEVRDEVRGVVTEIDRARGETVERGLVHALPATEPRISRAAGPSEDEDTAESRETGDTERDSSSESPDGSAEATSPTTPGAPVRQVAAAQHHHTASAAQVTRAATTGTGTADRAPEHQRLQAAAGSAAPTAGAPASVGGVAGYLTAAPLPAPGADTVYLAAHRLHTVPADPADDPTVSPD